MYATLLIFLFVAFPLLGWFYRSLRLMCAGGFLTVLGFVSMIFEVWLIVEVITVFPDLLPALVRMANLS
jgi:hypothetical protein